MSKSNRRTRRVSAAPLVAAFAVAIAMAPAAAQAAPKDTVGASAKFKPGALTVKAPTSAVSFAETQLDGSESYELVGDIGDWNIVDARGGRAPWTVTVSATDPTAADNGETAADAVMTMKVPVAKGRGAAPTLATGDADGFVRLNTAGGVPMVEAAAGGGIGKWDLQQAGAGDLKLVMPFDTRAVQYDSTLTFTTSQAL
jgi:hypothetical protein